MILPVLPDAILSRRVVRRVCPPAMLVWTALLLAGCGAGEGDGAAESSPNPDTEPAAMMNSLTDEERAEGWELLFDGEDASPWWRSFGSDEFPDGWAAMDGTLARVGAGGDIVTRETFADFELALEWRVEEGGNSGVMYRGDESEDFLYMTGPEMQILDDAGHIDGEAPLTSAGSVYGLYPAPRGVVHPAGEWNSSRVVAQGDHVEHWLNGERIIEYEQGSDDWNERVANSKFADWSGFGTVHDGYIGLQDHGDPVYFRNIKIRRLDP